MVILSTEATRAWLANVAELNIVAIKPQKTWNRTSDTNAVVTDFIVNVFPARLGEEAATVMDNIAIAGKTLNDGWILKLMRCVEDRPCLDRLSTECRPLYRPTSRSTFPTVNKIHRIFTLKNSVTDPVRLTLGD